MNGPSDDSAVINYYAEVHDQVQAKKRNEECNKRDATVLEKLKASSVEDIVLDKMKTQILSIAGVDYASLSAKVRLYYCREMGIMVLNKKRKKEEITELRLNHVKGWNTLSDYQHDMFYRRKTAFPGEKNMLLYEGMINLYKDISEYNMIDVLDQLQMVRNGVEEDRAIDFDKLNLSKFKECLDFIMAHYREAHNNKNKSGSHQPFADHTSGKPSPSTLC